MFPSVAKIGSSLAHTCLALLLACNYFAFQVELFEDEYEANHPIKNDPSGLSAYGVTWESFDKDDVPEPFVFDPIALLDEILTLPHEVLPLYSFCEPVHPVRDKSPPHHTSLPISMQVVVA